MSTITLSNPSSRRRNFVHKLLSSPVTALLAGPHTVDHYLELWRHDASIKHARARVLEISHQTPDSVTLKLKPTWSWSGFKAGQHIDLAVDINGVRHRRCYSLAGVEHGTLARGVGDFTVELTCRTHPDGVVSQYLKQNAQPGMFVGLSSAQGDFTLPVPRPEEIVLISGGSGITPMLSMLRTLVAEGYKGRVRFLHYARSERDLLYRDELQRIASENPNVELVRAYTRSTEGGELSGHFQASHLDGLIASSGQSGSAAFVCGPGALVEAVREHWATSELKASLAYEHFAPPPLPEIDPNDLGTLSFSRSSVAAQAVNRPILEQAEMAGLEPKHGCRMGICTTCACLKTEGRVRNILTGEISGPDEEEVRICISVPIGDVSVEI